ncbi:uncharacterized protein LACBIDRAFT_307939 [Laccaria bicolor S238N-H82]|uniref:Predicted protein n=1 Tax=Laccaria bicolor (strain S238N-H82 / ATCC MYA-4686) TaxID=486041 RepID=B0DR92_LACBS|nr:uncharacterized protein LACBIDRAFT_307939 [Laccaria bicolor S238N-H82]EDR02742.1 predicted protein [Laccaria bicolor S238N-H82]|eukprot:XP_001886452.1 predicted protein [Laccaria bicolor S238N-H82]
MARFIFSSFGSEVQGTAICSASSCFLVNVMDQVELIEISVVFRASSESQRVTSSHDFLICEEIKKMLLAALSGEFDWYPGGALLELRVSTPTYDSIIYRPPYVYLATIAGHCRSPYVLPGDLWPQAFTSLEAIADLGVAVSTSGINDNQRSAEYFDDLPEEMYVSGAAPYASNLQRRSIDLRLSAISPSNSNPFLENLERYVGGVLNSGSVPFLFVRTRRLN